MEQTPMPITRRKRANPPDQPENNSNNHLTDQAEGAAEPLTTERAHPLSEAENPVSPAPPTSPVSGRTDTTTPNIAATPNGERAASERQEYTPTIEGGRRTARGELFRRPPQPPPPVPVMAAAPLQAPSHEIGLPLGNLLHLAYNPGYTGSDEARSALLHQLAHESKAGGRARCWSCGSLAIVYECWNTRSRTFGEVGVAICEICGVWSVM